MVSQCTSDDVVGARESGKVSKGMIPKLEAVVTSLRAGVRAAHIIDGRIAHSVLLEIMTDDAGLGTKIVLGNEGSAEATQGGLIVDVRHFPNSPRPEQGGAGDGSGAGGSLEEEPARRHPGRQDGGAYLWQALHPHACVFQRGQCTRWAGCRCTSPSRNCRCASRRASKTRRACFRGTSMPSSSGPSRRKTWRTWPHGASVPVINALTDDNHPCQALADIFTFRERFADSAGRKIVYLGDGNNVAASLAEAAAMAGSTSV